LESVRPNVISGLWEFVDPKANRREAKEDNVLSHVQDAADAGAADTVGAVMTDAANPLTSDALLAEILTSLEEDKAEEIVKIDLRGKSAMADWMVIASGRSSRQVAAIAEHLVDRLKQDFKVISKVEGKDAGDWVLIDSGDVIIHLFRPEVREFYQLEKMWLSPSEAAAGTPG
jgi:ribosome-associated protein